MAILLQSHEIPRNSEERPLSLSRSSASASCREFKVKGVVVCLKLSKMEKVKLTKVVVLSMST